MQRKEESKYLKPLCPHKDLKKWNPKEEGAVGKSIIETILLNKNRW